MGQEVAENESVIYTYSIDWPVNPKPKKGSMTKMAIKVLDPNACGVHPNG